MQRPFPLISAKASELSENSISPSILYKNPALIFPQPIFAGKAAVYDGTLLLPTTFFVPPTALYLRFILIMLLFSVLTLFSVIFIILSASTFPAQTTVIFSGV